MNIAITGSSGFIGSAISTRLSLDKTITLSFFDRKKHSLRSVSSLKTFVQDQDIIIHLAGVTKNTAQKIGDFYEINTLGTANLLEAIKEYGHQKTAVIFASSFAVYAQQPIHRRLGEDQTKTIPRNQYGLSKLFAEQLLIHYHQNYSLPIRILRIASPYGPGAKKGVIATFIKNIHEGKPISLNRSGNYETDFIFIEDVVDAISKALSYKDPSVVVNICSGRGTHLNMLVNKLEKLLGKKAVIEYTNSQENGYWVGNPKKASQLLDFNATTLIDNGLYKTVTALS